MVTTAMHRNKALSLAFLATATLFACSPAQSVGPARPVAPAPTAGALEPAVTDSTMRSEGGPARTWDDSYLRPEDVFALEWVDDPQISPDGSRVAYLRKSFDIMTDRVRSELWLADAVTGEHRPLLSGTESVSAARFSPDGTRLLYAASSRGKTQLFLRWLDTGQTALLTQVQQAPSSATWSPDGRQIALTMRIPSSSAPMVTMPEKPKGADWAAPAKVIDQMTYRADGLGYLDEGYSHLFVVSAIGGTARQLTTGDYNHASPDWSSDSKTLFVSANRREDADFEIINNDIFAVDVASAELTQLTDRDGPDSNPVVSPDGSRIAYRGFDDERQGYQVQRLYVMNQDGSGKAVISADFDRDIGTFAWASDSRRLYVQYDDRGNTKIGLMTLDGNVTELTGDVGGTVLGRPYASGAFTVSKGGRIAFTHTRPEHPADLAVRDASGKVRTLLRPNDDLFSHKSLGQTEEIVSKSLDGRDIHSWVVKPPDFDPSKKYPLILEIHGGPFANYGDRFSAEIQLYAAAGFVVVYSNPRGSTSYGKEFGNLIHHNYPSQDYDDLMSAVDAVMAQGYIDDEKLYVTGGSGGGVLTAWIVGKTQRFRAAVVAKPVINWASFVLYADVAPYFLRYWFPSTPWEDPDHYWARSPLSLVGNVETPTMLLTGEVDYRTPISESEQYYQALKIRKIDTALVRIPGASHGIAARPSQLITKVLHILAWFDKHGMGGGQDDLPG